MRGQLLLGKKGWKERRDLAGADEASSAALRFVSWVFLSFSLWNFRSCRVPDSPPLRYCFLKKGTSPCRLLLCICSPGILPQNFTEYLSLKREEKKMARGVLDWSPNKNGCVQRGASVQKTGVRALRLLVRSRVPDKESRKEESVA